MDELLARWYRGHSFAAKHRPAPAVILSCFADGAIITSPGRRHPKLLSPLEYTDKVKSDLACRDKRRGLTLRETERRRIDWGPVYAQVVSHHEVLRAGKVVRRGLCTFYLVNRDGQWRIASLLLDQVGAELPADLMPRTMCGRLAQSPTFSMELLVGQRLESLLAYVGNDESDDRFPLMVYLKAADTSAWHKLFLNAGLVFWEAWPHREAPTDVASRVVDVGARTGLAGNEIKTAQAQNGAFELAVRDRSPLILRPENTTTNARSELLLLAN